MGWQKAEAQTALRRSGHDVGTAAALLETEEEERKELMTKVGTMVISLNSVHILTIQLTIQLLSPYANLMWS